MFWPMPPHEITLNTACNTCNTCTQFNVTWVHENVWHECDMSHLPQDIYVEYDISASMPLRMNLCVWQKGWVSQAAALAQQRSATERMWLGTWRMQSSHQCRSPLKTSDAVIQVHSCALLFLISEVCLPSVISIQGLSLLSSLSHLWPYHMTSKTLIAVSITDILYHYKWNIYRYQLIHSFIIHSCSLGLNQCYDNQGLQ